MDKRINLFNLLRNEGKLTKLLVYPAVEREIDPTEHTTEKRFLYPIAIKALVQQISFEALRWKYFGLIPQDSVQIITESKYENLLKIADKIEIDGIFYKCYKDDNGFRILRRSDYIICILERKNG